MQEGMIYDLVSILCVNGSKNIQFANNNTLSDRQDTRIER